MKVSIFKIPIVSHFHVHYKLGMTAVDSPMVMDDEMEVGEKMETATPSANVIVEKSSLEETKKETVYMLDMEEYKEEIYSYLVEAQVI